MCRTVHAVLQTLICGIQMLVRVLMTILLMIENLVRMILQTLYNFISFMLQLLSLIPICVVFLVSARLKCFMCGGGGGCQPGRGGACDCIMSLLAIVILFFIFKSTGVMDKIFYSMGYAKAAYESEPYVPTPGDITECSRNDTDQDVEHLIRTETYTAPTIETTAARFLQSLVTNYAEKVAPDSESIDFSTNQDVDIVATYTSILVNAMASTTIASTDIAPSEAIVSEKTEGVLDTTTTPFEATEKELITELTVPTELKTTEIDESMAAFATEAPDVEISDTPTEETAENKFENSLTT